ncbi:MAG: glutamate-5-semialdehyde dehydrogenase [Gemmataceae bacterium]|nr:glutamate-5-semialdehyde dehydrogenase [Gemmataceae bacterium]MDW8266213.1 glutamate-5-semialdehyde dehydrogenase [Gemmataceae bacterium]
MHEGAATTVSGSELTAYCEELGRKARAAARALATARGAARHQFLLQTAQALETEAGPLLDANARDLAAAGDFGLTPAQVDRLRLTPPRLAAAAAGLREVAALPDPIGRVLDSNVRPNGMLVLKVGVPLGVILFIYESRPNVTVDAAGLCVKSGNALILRGGKEALHSNRALHRLLQEKLRECGLPPDAVQLVTTPDREAVGRLLRLNRYIDLVIPRGGESLIRRVAAEATMPVLKHYQGNCHVYVHAAADLDLAERILVNAKCQRPGTCNAAESLLVDRAVAAAFLPRAAAALQAHGVELRGCPETRRILPDITAASDDDFAAEYLDLILSIKVVADLEEAIEHINHYGSGHTDAIVTRDLPAARRFAAAVDSAAVLINASTRLHDGYEFGLGAEIGISTDKLHARGPCGLQELTTYKYVVYGDGQLRS